LLSSAALKGLDVSIAVLPRAADVFLCAPLVIFGSGERSARLTELRVTLVELDGGMTPFVLEPSPWTIIGDEFESRPGSPPSTVIGVGRVSRSESIKVIIISLGAWPDSGATGRMSDDDPDSGATGRMSDDDPDSGVTGRMRMSDDAPDSGATERMSDDDPDSGATGRMSDDAPDSST